MTCGTTKIVRLTLVAAVTVGGLFIGEKAFVAKGSLVTEANARIGRPLTPMSYAGVARRTTRRAVGVGVAVGVGAAAVAAPVVVAPGCVQAVDAYGRIYTRCY
jgi:hypothetical protein